MNRFLLPLLLLALLVPGCLESNPQPSPAGADALEPGADTAGPVPGEDTAPGGDMVLQDLSSPDAMADGVEPPEDSVETDAMDVLPDLPDIDDIGADLFDLLPDLPDACVPDCDGPFGPKDCGGDGCGGSCGVCMNSCDPCGAMGGPYEDPELCMDGYCAQVCCPLCCDDLACGDDGCGGACGMCGEGEVCVQNQCEPDGETCGDPDKYADCTADLDEAACVEAGGTFGMGGLSPIPFCLCPSGDGGCPCHDGDTCVGICYAPLDGDCQELTEGTCSDTKIMFGCFCIFQEPGEAWGICID